MLLQWSKFFDWKDIVLHDRVLACEVNIHTDFHGI
jgi:hypothetical protein